MKAPASPGLALVEPASRSAGKLNPAVFARAPGTGRGLFVSYRNAAQSVPGTMRIEGSNRRLSLHWTSLAEGNANFSIVIVFRYADDLMVGFEEEAERLQGIN